MWKTTGRQMQTGLSRSQEGRTSCCREPGGQFVNLVKQRYYAEAPTKNEPYFSKIQEVNKQKSSTRIQSKLESEHQRRAKAPGRASECFNTGPSEVRSSRVASLGHSLDSLTQNKVEQWPGKSMTDSKLRVKGSLPRKKTWGVAGWGEGGG